LSAIISQYFTRHYFERSPTALAENSVLNKWLEHQKRRILYFSAITENNYRAEAFNPLDAQQQKETHHESKYQKCP
jgi:hypothetical protein